MPSQHVVRDANQAVSDVAYRLSEVVAIYPITPASPMGEHADAWAAADRPNLWGQVPTVIEMQSEGGAAGAVHGALQAGTLSTTFTASQGLLLMIPNLFKIAGELTPAVIHVAARTVATHALSIFADHSDVYSCRGCGLGMLASGSVQEAQDLALVAHTVTLKARVPFLHFFDGFRTSHELATIQPLSDDDLAALVDRDTISAHRARALNPERPVVRGTAQNPDVFFQAREAANSFYDACPGLVEETLEAFAARTGRRYRLFDYVGHSEAERVVVAMGSGAEAVQAAVEHLVQLGQKVGLVKVRLYRPFSWKHLVQALPETVTTVGVLDRSKEPGAPGEPLYLDVLEGLARARRAGMPVGQAHVVGGRFGLSSKEFTPAMAVAVFDELRTEEPKNPFTVGIHDDLTGLSLRGDASVELEDPSLTRAVFYGLGSDGTVGANKNTIRILGEDAGLSAQGFFVYDSKKSGAVTVSHLRFGEQPIRAPWLISGADLVAVHQWTFWEKLDVLATARPGSTGLLNAPFPADEVWDRLPRDVQERVSELDLQLWTVDAVAVAREAGMGRRINTVMQTCFFLVTGLLPEEQALAAVERTIRATYGKKGLELVERNLAAVRGAKAALSRVTAGAVSGAERPNLLPADAPAFVRGVTGPMMAGRGDDLPTSAFVPDGTFPLGTTRFEKRRIALSVPKWDPVICIQCNKCAMVCPHAAIRVKAYPEELAEGAPEGFRSMRLKGGAACQGQAYTVQLAPDDCTGCTLCVQVCPAKDRSNPRHKALDMVPLAPELEREQASWDFFLDLPAPDPTILRRHVKESQLRQPLFEFSGACTGCGETPYVKLLTQLFGDRLLIANATGCSSIYGGNLPTTPYTTNDAGRGPAWSNSLFEDNAEFGLGMKLAVASLQERARQLLGEVEIPDELRARLATQCPDDEVEIAARRVDVDTLRDTLMGQGGAAKELSELADYLVRKTVWIVGGDGWAYDIGFGGLDHVLASGLDVNILVLDTEVYSNTGGQRAKATPLGAIAKFAASGKDIPKKDLGLVAMAYGNAYVAKVAMGAKDSQTVKALLEAESFPGPSLVIAYSPCIAHGYDLGRGLEQAKAAVASGYWPIYRFDPRRVEQGEAPLVLDCPEPKIPLEQFAWMEARFRMLKNAAPKRAKELMVAAARELKMRRARYRLLANLHLDQEG